MALTNNTKYRRSDITITKRLNGAVVTTGGFPLTISIKSAFSTYPALSNTDFLTMSDAAYNARLDAFYGYLEGVYPFFVRTSVQNSPSGTDAVLCPLNNDPIVTPTIVAIAPQLINPLGTGFNHLKWQINLSGATTIELNYTFQVNISSSLGTVVKTETISGVIPIGPSSYDAYSVDGISLYLPEADDPALSPITVNVVPGSAVLTA